MSSWTVNCVDVYGLSFCPSSYSFLYSLPGYNAILYYFFYCFIQMIVLLSLFRQLSLFIARIQCYSLLPFLLLYNSNDFPSIPFRQSAEVGAIMSRGCPDHQVNDITARHLEAADLARAEWDSAISVLKEQQLRNFRTMLRDGQVAGSLE